jgi:hypothetical protein
VRKRNINHKYTKLRTPKANGKVKNAHWIYDKELFQKTKFFSFIDREIKTYKYTHYHNYLSLPWLVRD